MHERVDYGATAITLPLRAPVLRDMGRKTPNGAMRVAILIISSLFPIGMSFSQVPSPPSLRDFLPKYLRLDPRETIRYFDAAVDFNFDGRPKVLVYVVGRSWCGSGGCPLVILTPEGSSYRVVTETTVSRTPIRVLDGSSSGWHNLGVGVSGGGTPGYEAELRFDGRSFYEESPRVKPPVALTGRGLRLRWEGHLLSSQSHRAACTQDGWESAWTRAYCGFQVRTGRQRTDRSKIESRSLGSNDWPSASAGAARNESPRTASERGLRDLRSRPRRHP